MGTAQPKKFYTPAEYYELEAKAEYKSDFYNGEIFPSGEVGPDGQLISMAGGSVRHSLICLNIGAELRQRLKGAPCRALESNVRLKVRATGLRTYPDVSVYCGERQYDPEDAAQQTLLNPTALFEVLSPSTTGYDLGAKAQNYRRLESLKLLVFVTQEAPKVELHFRQPGGGWGIQNYEGLESALPLADIGVELPLSQIYDGVDFTSER